LIFNKNKLLERLIFGWAFFILKSFANVMTADFKNFFK